MRISPITQNKFFNFRSKVTDVMHGDISDDLAQKIDDFEETHKNAKELGSGLFATAYVLNGTNYVIKESLPTKLARKQNDNFFPEARALEMLPPSVKNTQRLVAHVKTEKDNYYLLSTFVEGLPASYPSHPWNKNSFDGLFETLLSLDKAGIYHNDINQANCLIDKDHRASTIDYQFAQAFETTDSENPNKLKTSRMMAPSNAQMFEMASLPWYIRTMSKTAPRKEVRSLFKSYLESKSQYAKQRALYLRQDPECRDMARYELLQAKYLENPTDEMIDLQAKKLQIMYSFRKTFSVTDPNSNQDKNIGSAIQSYIYTIAAAKDMENYANYLASKTYDLNLKEFLGLEAKFAHFWCDMMESELGLNKTEGVYPWLARNAELDLRHKRTYVTQYDNEGCWSYWQDDGISEDEDLSSNFKAAEIIQPETIDDIAGMIIENKSWSGTPALSTIQKEEIKALAKELKEKIEKDNNPERPSVINSDVIDFMIQKQKFINNSQNVVNYAEDENFNALIASAILAQYQKNVASKTLNGLAEKIDIGEGFLKVQKEILSGDFNLDILKKSAKMLLDYITGSTGANTLADKKFLRFI